MSKGRNDLARDIEASHLTKSIFIAGALLLGLAVGLGAIGAHALETALPQWYDDHERRLDAWHTAVFWQTVHALGLMLVAISPVARAGRGRLAAGLFVAGTILFSGCLYGWIISGQKFLVAPVPVGGTLLIAGWIALAVSAAKTGWSPGNSADSAG